MGSINRMKVTNKRTGEDVTKHCIDMLSGKISHAEFRKRAGITNIE
jgi:hypothetical protein